MPVILENGVCINGHFDKGVGLAGGSIGKLEERIRLYLRQNKPTKYFDILTLFKIIECTVHISSKCCHVRLGSHCQSKYDFLQMLFLKGEIAILGGFPVKKNIMAN